LRRPVGGSRLRLRGENTRTENAPTALIEIKIYPASGASRRPAQIWDFA